jgi:hypothetical protein
MAISEKMYPPEYLKARKEAKKSGKTLPEPADLDWAYFYDNETLPKITKTTNISSFCKIQHLKYIAHVARLHILRGTFFRLYPVVTIFRVKLYQIDSSLRS